MFPYTHYNKTRFLSLGNMVPLGNRMLKYGVCGMEMCFYSSMKTSDKSEHTDLAFNKASL